MKNNLILLGISLIVGVALAEGMLLILDISEPVGYRADENLGWVPVDRDWPHETKLGGSQPPLKIAVLGDSMLEPGRARNGRDAVSTAMHYVNTRQCGNNRAIEAYNYSLGNFGTAQEFLTYEQMAKELNVDLVILGFFIGNDLINNSRQLDRSKHRPFFDVVDNQIEIDTSFNHTFAFYVRAWLAPIVDHSRILQLLNRARLQIVVARHKRSARRNLEGAIPERSQIDDTAQFNEPGIGSLIYLPVEHPDWIQAWNITEKALEHFIHTVRNENSDFMLVIINTAIQANPDDEYRRSFTDFLGADNLSYTNSRLVNFAEQHQIPVLDLAPGMLEEAKRQQACLHGDSPQMMCRGHYNADGHEAAGRLMGEAICDYWSN